jgi:hypothetical protein
MKKLQFISPKTQLQSNDSIKIKNTIKNPVLTVIISLKTLTNMK